MYEQFFLLERRPFSPTPSADCFVPTPTSVEAVEGIRSAIGDGAPIVVLTAPGGLGKTVVCQRVAADLPETFQPVLVSSSRFSSSRALLQACLFELGASYSRMPEDEMRLGLLERLREINREGKTAVLLLDEAHLIEPTVFEELRVLADAQFDGRRLATVVLAGQLELEERLAEPRLDSVNQRVHRHLMLEPLSREESQAYVADKIASVGGDAETCFDEEALELIARTADGSPRALNQLCDQTMLLAHVDERRPADVEVVLEAYENLKHLPLHWNAPLKDDHETSLPPEEETDLVDEPTVEVEPETHAETTTVIDIVESPADARLVDDSPAPEAVVFEVGWSDEPDDAAAPTVEVLEDVEGAAETAETASEELSVAEPVSQPPVVPDVPVPTLPGSPLGKFDEAVEWLEEPLPVESRRLRGLPVDPTATESVTGDVDPHFDEAENLVAEQAVEMEPPVIEDAVVLPEASRGGFSDVVLPESEQLLTGPAATFEIGGEPEAPITTPERSEPVEPVVADATSIEEPEPTAAVEPAPADVELQIERDLERLARETQRVLRSEPVPEAREARYDVVEPEPVTEARLTEDEPAFHGDHQRPRGRRPRRYARLFSELRRQHSESRR